MCGQSWKLYIRTGLASKQDLISYWLMLLSLPSHIIEFVQTCIKGREGRAVKVSLVRSSMRTIGKSMHGSRELTWTECSKSNDQNYNFCVYTLGKS